MTKGSGLVAALALALLLPPTGARPFAQAQPRGMYVSAIDEKGSPVTGLGPADFIIREDNVAREVLSVAPANDAIHVAVLVDTSEASSDFVRDYRQALPAFTDAILGAGTGRTRSRSSGLASGPRSWPITRTAASASRPPSIGSSRFPTRARTCSTASSKPARDSRSARQNAR